MVKGERYVESLEGAELQSFSLNGKRFLDPSEPVDFNLTVDPVLKDMIVMDYGEPEAFKVAKTYVASHHYVGCATLGRIIDSAAYGGVDIVVDEFGSFFSINHNVGKGALCIIPRGFPAGSSLLLPYPTFTGAASRILNIMSNPELQSPPA